MDEPQTRRRWPWIVAGLLLFCGLPLGGCVALVGFGVREVNERSDQISDAGNLVMTTAMAGNGEALAVLTDGGPGCVPTPQLVDAVLAGTAGATDWDSGDVAFVDRNGNSYLANVSEPETFVVPGREAAGTAQMRGDLAGAPAVRSVQLTLLKTGDTWKLCNAEFAV